MNKTVILLLSTLAIFFTMPEKVDVDFKLNKRDVVVVGICLTAVSLFNSNRTRRYY